MRRILGVLWCSLALCGARPRSPLAAHIPEEEHAELLAKVAAPDGSVCLNRCSSHGRCVNYVCECEAGWHGADCRYNFGLPVLSVGHGNVTSAGDFKALLRSHKRSRKSKKTSGEKAEELGSLAEFSSRRWVLLGVSSTSCHKCSAKEDEYDRLMALPGFAELDLAFLRLDAAVPALHQLAKRYGLGTTLPYLMLFRDGAFWSGYEGRSGAKYMLLFLQKQMLLEPVSARLTEVQRVRQFLNGEGGEGEDSLDPGVVATYVVGVFRDSDMEDEEFEEFEEAADGFQKRHDVYFASVVGGKLADALIAEGYVDRTPSLLLQYSRGVEHSWAREDDTDAEFGVGTVGHRVSRRLWSVLPRAITASFEELSMADDMEQSVDGWVKRNSIPALQQLTPTNFAMYAGLGLPMLMLFLDLTGGVEKGSSGQLQNRRLLEEFYPVAKEFRGRIFCVFADGVAFADRMKVLGINGGASSLPALAWNTLDNRKVAFPEDASINRETLSRFVVHFLNGKIASQEDAAKVIAEVRVSSANKPKRPPRPAPPEEITGVQEMFDGVPNDHVLPLTPENWDTIAMDEYKDVVVMFHDRTSKACANFTPYYRKVGERFSALSVPSVVVARYDVTDVDPPRHEMRSDILAGNLPVLILLPAYQKDAVLYYSGVGKVPDIMSWVERNAGVPFKLPRLAHLTPEQRVEYEIQVGDHAVARAKEEL